jgi:hypothetical protein
MITLPGSQDAVTLADWLEAGLLTQKVGRVSDTAIIDVLSEVDLDALIDCVSPGSWTVPHYPRRPSTRCLGGVRRGARKFVNSRLSRYRRRCLMMEAILLKIILSAVWHSHITSTRHPAAASSTCTFASRA